MIQFDEHIFSNGWFNHQRVQYVIGTKIFIHFGGIKFLMQMLYPTKMEGWTRRNPYYISLEVWVGDFFLTPGKVGIRTLPRIYGQIVLRYCLGDVVFCLPMNLVEQPSQFSDILITSMKIVHEMEALFSSQLGVHGMG